MSEPTTDAWLTLGTIDNMINLEAKSGKITIPGRPVEVNLSQVRGDTDSGIRFEISPEDKWAAELDRGPEIQNALKKGGRVFVTEGDDLLIVEPPF